MKKLILNLILLFTSCLFAQVGINTTTPNAQLDIRSSSQTSPLSTDGILIPKIDTFPSSNPGLDQNGMLVFLSTIVGVNTPGFYYWDANTNNWVKILTGASSGGTLDDAYNFGGPGFGKEIVANAGPLTISGNDGIISTGSLGTGFTSPVGNGERLVWNPSRAAFRAGTVTMNQWEQSSLGLYSFSFGRNNFAEGDFTGAWGEGNQVLGTFSTLWGESNSSSIGSSHGTVFGRFNSFQSGNNSVIWGVGNIVNADNSTIFGTLNQTNGSEQALWGSSNTILAGQLNTVWGKDNEVNASQVSVWGENNQGQSNFSTLWGRDNNSNCIGCTVWGSFNIANSFSVPNYEDNTVFGRNNTITYGNSSTAWGLDNFAQSKASTVFGISNFARSVGETVLGIGATDYFPVGGAFSDQFDINFGTDRLLVVGNAIDLNSNSLVEVNERRDALVILKNGNTGIGESFPQEKLHVAGKIRMADGSQGAGKILVGDSDGTLSWQDNNSWGLSGNSGTNSSSNFMGTVDNNDVIFRRNSFTSGVISLNNTLFGTHNALSSFIPGTNNSFFGTTNFMLTNIINDNTVIGHGTVSSSFQGNGNTVVGSNAMSSVTQTNNSIALGFNATVAEGTVNAAAIGANSYAEVSNSIVLGGVAGLNGALTNVNVGIGTISPQAPLHVVGNLRMVDGNQAVGRVLVSDANGTASWQLTPGGAGLNEAYNFGGPGVGRTITADAGAVTIAGTDGLVSTGAFNSGAIAPSGAGTRMVWNPRKLAFRAGSVDGDQWDDINIGFGSAAFGQNTTASGTRSTAFGIFTIASEAGSTAFGTSTTASGIMSTAFGLSTVASGFYSTSFGFVTSASGNMSTAFGRNNTAPSNGETVIGIGATTYTPSVNGAIQFRAANATDRLFVIGNAIDANNNNTVDDSERSDAMVVLKNGDVGIGTSTPAARLHLVGNMRMVDGNQAAGRIMISDANGTASWQTLNVTSINGWSTTGNTGLSSATNFIGTTNGVDVIFRRNNIRAGRLGTSNTSFGVDALNPDVTGTFNTAVGSASLQNVTDGARNAAFGSVSLNANTTGNNNTAFGVDALSFNETGNNNTAVGRRAMGGTALPGGVTTGSNNTALGYFAYSTGNFSNSTALGANTAITASNQIRLGDNAVTSIGGFVGFTNLSDKRFKKNIQADVPGLAFIKKLKPVTYQLDMGSLTRFLNTPEEARDREAERTRENTLETGFIAQEVEQAARETGFVFSGVDAPKNSGDYYGLRYATFVVPLVKAMQEQQMIIEQQNITIENQQNELDLLKQQLQEQYQALLERIKKVEEK